MTNNGMVNECDLKNDSQTDEKRRGMVCRDFLRNSCWRGSGCKFQHPESPRQVIAFCHDFQNGDCRRTNSCRFIHSSVEDEMYYKHTGELPPHLLQRAEVQQLNSQSPSREEQTPPAPPPQEQQQQLSPVAVCNLKHLTEYKRLVATSPPPIHHLQPPPLDTEDLFPARRRMIFDYEPETKRRRGILEEGDIVLRANGYMARPSHEHIRPYMMMEEENMLLRAKISELKKRVDDLQATNEFLLEQNAQLRISDKTSTAGLTTVTVPAVTITNTVPGAGQMQQAPTPQQMVNAAIRTVTASVATVPVSIATVTPVSIAAVSMAPVQPTMAPIVTMASAAPVDVSHQASVAVGVGEPISLQLPISTAPPPTYPILSRPPQLLQPTDLRH
ncbi:zinc finger CCCH domain-containing protein 10 isoform X2 [Nilaparvata lugens]|uniref:zinc finger CCCH domain-containing protein 10 isoform X2 n=1 Tax=Nilaparvata lugens TaxID=108931 RepID=UPI000B98C689|nr:zinc finger CCCH domain-containing protein 10 isoform X2 [Nilaparvata lugens]XP_039280311.1 zinc finger CCCH domain-containing protein 10 isoform X2 [Nilaparvata lugens]